NSLVQLESGAFPLIDQLKSFWNKRMHPNMNLFIDQLQGKALKLLKGEELDPDWQKYTESETGEIDLTIAHDVQLVLEVLEGKLLFTKEILQAVSESYLEGWPAFQLKLLLQLAYLKGECQLYPGIAYLGQGKLVCVRCGTSTNIETMSCIDCNGSCFYCEECQTMGESKLCRPLYGVTGNSLGPKDEEMQVIPQLCFSLTKAQQDASEEVLEFVELEERREALVWAVCGAGKTEVSFAAISQVLQQGGRVLFAIPRRDVVLELLPRLEKAFPQVEIIALYGGSQGKYAPAQLVVATTHQVIRFYRQFDLVVLDEVDAYPYKDNQMLHYAVWRAKKEGGKIIFMSATPSKEMYQKAKKGKMKLIHIPARHHGYPVPEPVILTGNHCKVQQDGKVVFSKEVLKFIHKTIEGDLAQLFIFTPSVYLTEQVGKSLKHRLQLPPFNDFAGEWVAYSHSRDPERDEKRIGFAAGEYPVLVSTTIMERGITMARANVLVLFANYQKIFDEGTLVQMAGRAGRSGIYPNGKVMFVGDKPSAAMEEAVARIKEQNQEAQGRGYLRESPQLARNSWGLK
ncbi:MAG: DEAD/DEAH box helicase family protein, partial [Bacillota bacterium]|nr:DEAD/DEAH box helicase family protein [Bacillota bacterium]